jgi:hypothetical protein
MREGLYHEWISASDPRGCGQGHSDRQSQNDVTEQTYEDDQRDEDDRESSLPIFRAAGV